MANVMSLKDLKNRPSRNGFDLSFKNAFTAKTGELLPVVVKECIPGDHFEIKGQAFSRTQPVNSAAYVRLREYYDFYFVPYRLLWQNFPQFVTQMDNQQHASAAMGPAYSFDKLPTFTTSDIVTYLNNLKAADADYQTNIFNYKRYDLAVKLLDMLGYGNWYSGGDIPAEVSQYVSTVNPFPLLAYHKIYNDYFRDSQWEDVIPYMWNLDYINQPGQLNALQQEIVKTSYCENLNIFDMHYCSWSKDYFMGLLPEAQYGDAAFVPLRGVFYVDNIDFDKINITASSGNNAAIWSNPNVPGYLGRISLQSDDIPAPSLTNPAAAQNSLTVLALRQAEFLQKWKEIAQSGDKDYKSQVEKHYGVSLPDALGDKCAYIGGWSSNMDISEVVNTNITGDNESEIAGKGVGTSQGTVDYDVKEHGIIIGIYHNMPLLDYTPDGIKKFNLKTAPEDFAIPEFDRTGMQLTQLIELVGPVTFVDLNPSTTLNPSTPLGFAPRYAEYKTSFDEVHGGFANTLSHWVSPIGFQYLLDYFNLRITGSVNYQNNSPLLYDFFKVNPSILDSIFAVKADASVNTDQFLVNSFFDIKAVRNLDYNGLPY